MTSEMVGDAIDDALDDEETEEESADLVSQVCDTGKEGRRRSAGLGLTRWQGAHVTSDQHSGNGSKMREWRGGRGARGGTTRAALLGAWG